MKRIIYLVGWVALLSGNSSSAAFCQDRTAAPQEPKIAAASDEGEQAAKLIRIPAGWEIKLFAAEPDVANPVALHVDFQNRLFVCESFRQEDGIEDNREHPQWLVDDLAAQTVADRVKYIRKHIKDADTTYTRSDDRIRLLIDSDNDGSADKVNVFSDRYNAIEMGTGAGVLSYRGDVFYTCIPDLWLLRDTNGDGREDVRKSLHTGFGVRFAFRGHDMHGLIIGPDGRLYFSIGDRGYNVSGTDLHDPASGAVFRCELDGSDLEVFATGLRNPQELAFDDYGNLFTGDNNSDSGDKARWVYVVQGGDSGWRMYYQYLPDRGPFNREKIWHPYQSVATPAYIVPPVTNLSDGPSGLTFYPGTGLSKHFDKRFFLCDFRGQKEGSGVRTFRVKPDGAFFKVVDMEETIWNILPTDVDFGPDGRIFFTDWVHGWVGEGKGRVYTLEDRTARDSAIVKETHSLLSGDFSKLDNEYLLKLMSHTDRRVRQESQFELVRRADFDTFLKGLDSTDLFANLHSLWGIGQLLRNSPAWNKADSAPLDIDEISASLLEKMKPLPGDSELRAQFAKLIGDVRLASALPVLRKMLQDENPRVRSFAGMSLSRFGTELQNDGFESVLEMIASNADRDPIVRHGGVMALVGMFRSELSIKILGASTIPRSLIDEAVGHPSVSVRVATCAALRRYSEAKLLEDARPAPLKILLNDADPRVSLEAARAIYDKPIGFAMNDLAGLADHIVGPVELIRRAIYANYRLGSQENANRIAAVAANPDIETAVRIEALGLLGNWAEPKPLDGFHGMYWPIEKRSVDFARDAVREKIADLFASDDAAIVKKTTELSAALEIREVATRLRLMVDDEKLPGPSRASALRALDQMQDAAVDEFASRTMSFNDPHLRVVARDIFAQRNPGTAFEVTRSGTFSPFRHEKQAAWQAMGILTDQESAAMLAESLADIKLEDEEVQLDVMQAAARRKESPVVEQLKKLDTEIAKSDEPLTEYFATRYGGDADRGRKIFFERVELSCVRCHKVGQQGGEVGPALTDIGSKKDRVYLLESIVLPNKTIADEFRSVVITDFDGRTHSGIVKEKTDQFLALMTSEGNIVKIETEDIDIMREGNSSMPDDLVKKISKQDVRDLIEFLAQQK